MKNFEEKKKEISLIDYLDSEFGTMYFGDGEFNGKDIIVRHLDGELTPELLPAYIELYDNILQYIENHPRIKGHVFMPKLIEIGKDYIIRPFYVYLVSINRYFDPDEPLEPPKQYYEMINAFSEEMTNQFSEAETIDPTKETIVKRVLRKSLLQPRGKTFLEGRYINKSIIVEPAISIEDLEEWRSKGEE